MVSARNSALELDERPLMALALGHPAPSLFSSPHSLHEHVPVTIPRHYVESKSTVANSRSVGRSDAPPLRPRLILHSTPPAGENS